MFFPTKNKETQMTKLLIFDFDGVLAIKWTNPELHYPQIPKIIQSLSEKHVLGVASYNPNAETAIRRCAPDAIASDASHHELSAHCTLCCTFVQMLTHRCCASRAKLEQR